MQLAAHYAREMGRSREVLPRWTDYLNANPDGPIADEARREDSGSLKGARWLVLRVRDAGC